MTLSAYAAPRCGSREALASMYADLGGQKHSDPGTFRSRLAWWTGTIAAACWDRVLPHALCWPVAWLAWTLVVGQVDGWVPYPFLDADDNGWGAVGVACAGITVLFLALFALFTSLDGRLRPAPR